MEDNEIKPREEILELPPDHEIMNAKPLTIAQLERQAIEESMKRHAGRRIAVAAELGIAPRTLYDKLRRYEEEDGNKIA